MEPATHLSGVSSLVLNHFLVLLIEKSNEINTFKFLGFISQLVQKREIEICVRCGIWAATQIIQQDGCTLPTNLELPEDFRP